MLRWIVETTVVTAVLALLIAALCRAGRWGPASRHILWLIVVLRFVTPSVGHWPVPRGIEGTIAPAAVEPTAEETAAVPSLEPDAAEAEDVAWLEPGPEDPAADAPAIATADGPPATAAPRKWPSLGTVIFGVWAAGALGLGLVSLVRLDRMCALLRCATEAPDWLQLEAELLAGEFGLARAPRLCVCEWSTTPFLWCLGRPRLVVPAKLVARLSRPQWSGILAHELAHLRRRDHWVSWLLLGASLPWWWDPVFWFVRRRLEADAELACDAWAVGVVPDGRRPLAEALVEVACGSRHAPHAPALGMSGAGRFLERRLIMIMRERVAHRSTRAAAIAAGMLGLLALPAWSSAQDSPRDERPREERPREERPDRPRPREEPRREAREQDRAGRDQVEKARAEIREIEAQLRKARDEMNEKMKRVQEQLHREMEAASKEVREKAERLMHAQQDLAKLEGRPAPARVRVEERVELPRVASASNPFVLERARVGGPLRVRSVPVEVRERRTTERRDGDRPREGDDLERRMSQLERRFDQLLDELRSQRRDRPAPETDRQTR